MKTEHPSVDRSERQESIKELYLYAVQRLNTERERFNRVDEKANKLAAVFVFIIGGILFFVHLIEKSLPPKSFIEWVLAAVTLITLLTAFYGWYLSVKTPALRAFAEPPFDFKVIKFFEQHGASDVRYAWAKEFVKAYQKNVRITNDKQLSVHAATSAMHVAVCELVLLCFLYFIKLSVYEKYG